MEGRMGSKECVGFPPLEVPSPASLFLKILRFKHNIALNFSYIL